MKLICSISIVGLLFLTTKSFSAIPWQEQTEEKLTPGIPEKRQKASPIHPKSIFEMVKKTSSRLPSWLMGEGLKQLEKIDLGPLPYSSFFRRLAKEEKRSLDEIRNSVRKQVAEFRERNGPITLKECESLWADLGHLFFSDPEGEKVVTQVYEQLVELDLPPERKLEVIRLVGQNDYARGKLKKANDIFEQAIRIYDQLSQDEKRMLPVRWD